MSKRPKSYHECNYRIRWSTEDNEFVATCDEFPSLSWLHIMPDKALAGLMKVVNDAIKDIQEGSKIKDTVKKFKCFRCGKTKRMKKSEILEQTFTGRLFCSHNCWDDYLISEGLS